MRTWIWSRLMLVMVPLVLMMPSFSEAESPGYNNGTIPDPITPLDIFYKANYSYVYNNDDQSGNWVSGITVKDVEYRDQLHNPYDYNYDFFVKKASMMWIRITWQDESLNQFSIIYPHAEVMSDTNGQFVLTQTGMQFYEGNRVQGQGGFQTCFSAEYGIDVDDDDYGDFVINESMTLNNWMVSGGAIELHFWLMDYPTNWEVGDYTVISMEFAYYMDIDIDNYDDNEVLFYNNDSSQWEGQDVEIGPVTVPYENGGQGQAANYKACVDVNHANHKAVLVPEHPPNAKPSWAYYYVVNNHNNEYSQDPSNYVNDEGLDADGADPAVWCIIGYDISANNFPPTSGNGNEMMIHITGFTA